MPGYKPIVPDLDPSKIPPPPPRKQRDPEKDKVEFAKAKGMVEAYEAIFPTQVKPIIDAMNVLLSAAEHYRERTEKLEKELAALKGA